MKPGLSVAGIGNELATEAAGLTSPEEDRQWALLQY